MEEYYEEITDLSKKRKEIDESIRDVRKNALKIWLGPLHGQIKRVKKYEEWVWSDYTFRFIPTGECVRFEIRYGIITIINAVHAPEDGWKDLRRVKEFKKLSKQLQAFVLLVHNQLEIDYTDTRELLNLIE
jgi:hypothetical protein